MNLQLKALICILFCFKKSHSYGEEPTPPSLTPALIPPPPPPPTFLSTFTLSSAGMKGHCTAWSVLDFSFESTSVGDIALSSIKCEPEDGKTLAFPAASVLCGLNNTTNEPQFLRETFIELDCSENFTEILKEVDKEEFFPKWKQAIRKIQLRLSNEHPSLSGHEVIDIIRVLEKINVLAKKNILRINSGTTLNYLIAILSKVKKSLTQASSIDSTLIKQRVVKLLPSFYLLSYLAPAQKVLNTNNSIFYAQAKNYKPLTRQNISFTSTLSGADEPSVSLFVPESVLQHAGRYSMDKNGSLSNLRTAIIAYRDESLFPSNDKALNILSVNVGLDPSANANLENPIVIRHNNLKEKPGKQKLSHTRLTVNETVLKCVHWDFSTGGWSDKGCRLRYSDGVAECECFHLTNFALLVSHQIVPANFALELVSAVGCGLSIAGLLVTILVLAYQRDLRKHNPGKILLHLCCSLCISYIVFISGVSSAVGSTAGCSAVTFLLHYFLLVTWAWMGIYSYEMYIEVVKVFNTYCTRFMAKASLIAYVIPAIIASLTIGLTLPLNTNESQEYDEFSEYFSSNACWLTGYPLIFGFLLPCGFVLLYNIFAFGAVILELKKKKLKRSHQRRLKYSSKDLLLIATTTTFLTGITWIFGYLLIFTRNDSVYTVLSWLFAVSSALQGFVIFLLTIVRRNKTRRLWWNSMKGIFRTESYYRSSFASFSGSTAPKASSLRSNSSSLKKESGKS